VLALQGGASHGHNNPRLLPWQALDATVPENCPSRHYIPENPEALSGAFKSLLDSERLFTYTATMETHPHVQKIRTFFREKKRMPSYAELTEVSGFRSKNATYKVVARLIDGGWLEKDAAGKILPGPLLHAVPVLGTVMAGFPSPAEEELTDTMSLDEYLISNKEATYLLKVNGESMLEAGILPGDMLLVERGAEPRDGDIVIAQVDREWTMKYFRKRGRAVFLEAANKDYKPIYPQEELNIAAVVRAVIRKCV
jgi:repressor LexA